MVSWCELNVLWLPCVMFVQFMVLGDIALVVGECSLDLLVVLIFAQSLVLTSVVES